MMATLSMLLLNITGIAIQPFPFLYIGAAATILGGIGWLYRYRAVRIAKLSLSLLEILSIFAVAAPLSYLAAMTNAPLADQTFDLIDRSLGFDWQWWYAWIVAQPVLHNILKIAYNVEGIELLLVVFFFNLLGQFAAARELNCLVLISVTVVIAIFTMLPATSPWVYYQVGLPTPWVHDFLALRSHDFQLFSLPATQPIVSCPSFHTVLAALLIYVARFHPWLFCGSLVLNGLILLSVPSEGSHYLIDVIAGLVVAALTIAAFRFTPGLLHRNNVITKLRPVSHVMVFGGADDQGPLCGPLAALMRAPSVEARGQTIGSTSAHVPSVDAI
jgi:hypothetical protein